MFHFPVVNKFKVISMSKDNTRSIDWIKLSPHCCSILFAVIFEIESGVLYYVPF